MGERIKPPSQRDRGYSNILHHVSQNDRKQNEQFKKIKEKLKNIEGMLKTIMGTEQAALEQLEGIKTNLGKIGSETTTLLEKITALEAAAQKEDVSPAVMDKIAEVKGQAQTVDDLVPDAVSGKRKRG